MEVADDLREQGKILCYVSRNFPIDLLSAALRRGVIVANQAPVPAWPIAPLMRTNVRSVSQIESASWRIPRSAKAC